LIYRAQKLCSIRKRRSTPKLCIEPGLLGNGRDAQLGERFLLVGKAKVDRFAVTGYLLKKEAWGF
jgi:hypothetical protein